ncbi:GntR family transcriptional regulator [Halomonas janggokensis]|uniref:GntR family transcriptional regulator n=1 Tax=Vreelandella janggokensis TaxID=370767 RepID=A0ABT4IU53_9GAMM|nr:GntR family transcriptional regulator [Halomonas janggokensis]MCZ0927190.1 GntR family transcriptional regulator [Halomonas janggokensis]MCZ0929698.1 GntR family transcriptional regulator [Halomonas janggokensis]
MLAANDWISYEQADHGGLSSVAYEAIMRMILARELSGGDIVQERRLADKLDMSRTPVREALRRLEAEGWLVRLNARTIGVKKIAINEYVAALQVRELLEPEAAALAAAKSQSKEIADWVERLDSIRLSKQVGLEQQWEFDQTLHMGIAQVTGNEVLVKIISELRKTTQIFENQTLPAKSFPGYDAHLAIINAIVEGDSDKARKAMHDHLRETKKNIFEAL